MGSKRRADLIRVDWGLPQCSQTFGAEERVAFSDGCVSGRDAPRHTSPVVTI